MRTGCTQGCAGTKLPYADRLAAFNNVMLFQRNSCSPLPDMANRQAGMPSKAVGNAGSIAFHVSPLANP